MEIPVELLIIVSSGLLWLTLKGWRFLQKKRSNEIVDVASSMNFKFSYKDDCFIEKYLALEFFNRGEGSIKKIKNILQGVYKGRQVMVFDYEWASMKYRQADTLETVIIFQITEKKLSDRGLFKLTKNNVENYFDKGVSLPAFDNKYWLIEKKNELIVFCKTHEVVDQRVRPNRLQEYIGDASQILNLL